MDSLAITVCSEGISELKEKFKPQTEHIMKLFKTVKELQVTLQKKDSQNQELSKYVEVLSEFLVLYTETLM